MNKVLIIFDSDTHENEYLAKTSANIIKKLEADVRVKRVDSIGIDANTKEEHYDSNVEIVTNDDLSWADSYIFTFPIHTGTISASLKYFFDRNHENISKGIFLNKPATTMCVGKIIHAGAETAIQHLYSMLMQWGCIIVPTSIALSRLMELNGNPYGLSFILDEKNSFGDESKLEETLSIHFKRLVEIIEILNKNTNAIEKRDINNPYNIVDSLS